MDKNSRYLKMGTQSAFSAVESLITEGYQSYICTQQEHNALQAAGSQVTEDKVKTWDSSYGNWVNETAKKLNEIYASTNYANEFILANNGGGLRVSTGAYSTLMQNNLGNIRKLEEYRNRLLDKSTLVINNSGQINVQVGQDLRNDQSK